MKTIKPPINRILLYAKNAEKRVDFYEKHFGFKPHTEEEDKIIELISPTGGVSLMIHQAAKTAREGQDCVKLAFNFKDVEAFRAKCAKSGLKFGAIHKANGYIFSNAKDLGKNSISLSSRAFRKGQLGC